MRMPMNGGAVPALTRVRDLDRGGRRVAVLFSVRPVAVAVFEIQPEVFDRFALQLLAHTRMHAMRQPPVPRRVPP